MHLSDAFIQRDLIQAIHVFISMCFLGIEPTTFALLTQLSTTEPQEHHYVIYNCLFFLLLPYLLYYVPVCIMLMNLLLSEFLKKGSFNSCNI